MTDSGKSIAVDLIAEQTTADTGIGRYVDQLETALRDIDVDVELHPFRYLPGANYRSVLKALPIGTHGRRPGSVVHIPQSMGASLLLTRRLQPCVVTVHDLGALYCPEDQPLFSRTGLAIYELSLRGMRRADHIVAVSEFTRAHVIKAGYDPDRVSVVHEGVDAARFVPRENARSMLAMRYAINLPDSTPIVLYVGSEQPRKNLGTLVQALAELKQQGVLFHWIKGGRHGYAAGREHLKRLIADLDLSDQVTIVEDILEEDLPSFYSAADVYVQPSVWEGFGLPVLEAMACGTAVVASTAGSLPEVCGDATLLVHPNNQLGIAEAIRSILTNPDLRSKLQIAGRARASEFTWRSTAMKTRSIYECLVGSKN